jgi:hypothetical protein
VLPVTPWVNIPAIDAAKLRKKSIAIAPENKTCIK